MTYRIKVLMGPSQFWIGVEKCQFAGAYWRERARGPLCVLRMMELTVLLTPLIFITLFLRMSLNSSMSEEENRVTMSNSPVTSKSSSRFSSLERAATTLSISVDSTKISIKARSLAKFGHSSTERSNRKFILLGNRVLLG
jgi:hypothetical protein